MTSRRRFLDKPTFGHDGKTYPEGLQEAKVSWIDAKSIF
jgi:hypothetical protein